MFVVDQDNYEAEVIQYKGAVMVDVWGPQCGPCLELLPQIEGIEADYQGKVKFCKLNSSENRKFCMSMKVMGLPTILFYKDGENVHRLSAGSASIENIKAELDKLA